MCENIVSNTFFTFVFHDVTISILILSIYVGGAAFEIHRQIEPATTLSEQLFGKLSTVRKNTFRITDHVTSCLDAVN